MSWLRRWWWPLFVFLYPFIVWPGSPYRVSVVLAHIYVTTAFALVGLFLELTDHPNLHLWDLARIPRALLRHPPMLIATLYGLWALLGVLASPVPIIALTGAVIEHVDGALWSALLVLVFVLVYLRILAEPAQARRLILSFVAGGTLLALAALVEVLWGHGFYYKAAPGDLPVVSFPQRGHLAGYFAFVGGAALGLGSSIPIVLLSLAVGLTFNRAGILGLGGAWLSSVWVQRKLAPLLLLVVGLLAGWGLIRFLDHSAVRRVTSPRSVETRLYFWRAAVGGIERRPIFGWGGGVFEHYWPEFLSPKELRAFLAAQWDAHHLVRTILNPGEDPTFLLSDHGRPELLTIIGFKAHDQFLEVALMHGLVGLALYLWLLFYGLRGLPRGDPAALALLAYHLFLIFWFTIPESEGALWAVWAVAAIGGWRPYATGP